MRASLLLFSLAPLCLSATLRADTLTVGPSGSGADFDDVGAAVAAAAAGDVVLIAPGSYSSFGTITIDKPLTVVGAGSDSTRVTVPATLPFDVPLPLRIADLGAGEEVRVIGVELVSLSLQGQAASAFVVEDCDGPVVLADVASSGPTVLFGPSRIATIRNSAQVSLDGCALLAGSSTDLVPAVALEVFDAEVFVNDSELRGGTASVPLSTVIVPNDGSPALRADGSVVRLSGSSLIGGDGQQGLFVPPTVATDGGAAVVATDSTVFVRGGVGSELRGGAGGVAEDNGVPAFGSGGAAVDADPTSLVTATPDAALSPGSDGDGLVVSPAVGGLGAFVPLGAPLATLAIDARILAPGGSATFEQSGEPLATYASWFALDQATAVELPGFLGPLVLPIGPSIPLATTVLDAAGSGATSIPIPPGPALVGTTLLAQGLAIAPSGTLSFSAPTFAAIR